MYPKDPRLKPEKLRSWRKRYKDDIDEQSCRYLQSQSSSLLGESILSFRGTSFSDKALVKPDTRIPSAISEKQTQTEALDDVSSPGTLQSSPRVQSPANSVSETSTLSEDSWLINWSTVEVPQSPNLSRLFKALKIECENPVPGLSLEPGYLPDVPRCISERQIQDLFNNGNKILNSNGNNELYSSEKYKPPLLLPLVPTGQQSPIADLQDFAKAVFFRCPTDPLNELYVFSGNPSGGPTEANLSGRTVWGSLASQETDFETILLKLPPRFSSGHRAVVAATENLSQTYYNRRKYAEAEVLDKKLIILYSKELGSENLKTLDAQQRLVDTLVAQGKYYEARSINRSLFSSFLRIGHLGIPRIAHMLSNDALIAEQLGYTSEAESLLRQVLQLWLEYCGPRDKRTLNSMTKLGYFLVLTNGPGGDMLLRTAVHLHLEGSNATDEEACRAMTILSAAFWAQDTHKEGCKLAQKALEKFGPVLGHEHPDILETKVALARNMAKGGDLFRSEKLFREVIATESNAVHGAGSHGLSNSKCGLARVLMLSGCYNEAIKWYLEVLQARASAYGWDYPYTLRVCYDLGECYQMCKRVDDAIILYRDVVRRLWMTDHFGNAFNPDIDDLESCINVLEASSLHSKGLLRNDSL
jgi:tetratricopeptide (TPR) repeat protein